MSASAALAQPSFDDLGQPLSETTFVVVDLETTGAAPTDEITEIGAVRVRGGETLGEFQTLVRPHGRIPAMIAVLTGITDQMVAGAPRISQVLGSFLEFAEGAVIVAHNARFDVGFLKRACDEHGVDWGRRVVVDTVALSRRALLRDEVPNHKLATLAAHFHAEVAPNHRALSDARATVEVLHALLERVGAFRVDTLEDLREFTNRVEPERRAKRGWAADLPERPGVYWFVLDHADRPQEVLYVGKAKDLRRRVRSYFGASETRARVNEMVRVASGVRHNVCSTELEALIHELRMIAAHSPRYNRRSREQHRLAWLKLTKEAFPRLSVVWRVTDDSRDYWGPFRSKAQAMRASDAVHEAFALRSCSTRLSPTSASPACALAEIGRCPAPCELGPGVAAHAEAVAGLRDLWRGDVRQAVANVAPRLRRLVGAQRFEDAAELSDRVKTLVATSIRHHRVRSLADCPQIVAAAPGADGWDVHVVRHARLAAAGACESAAGVQELGRELAVLAETDLTPPPGSPGGTFEEAELVAGWLESPGVRLLSVEGEWSQPMWSGLDERQLAKALSPG